MEPVKVGLVGCGTISRTYFETAKLFESFRIVACADQLPERAQAKAEEQGIRALTVDDLVADPEVELVLNLTIPKAHAEVARKALLAGKHAYNEKPLAVGREEGRELVRLAAEKGLRLGGAPDTFLGAGIQTCRKLIADGWIGEPIAATAFMMSHGHESWHPDPAFYYQPGGGPMFDMGPYYLTALVALIGPMARVTGSTRITFPERTITSKPKYGQQVQVEVDTHVAGLIDFANGAVGTIITTFDVWAANLPNIEIYGTAGSMRVPDPNGFGGAVKIKRPGMEDWVEIPHTHPHAGQSRGLGVADMAYAIRSGRKHRANGELTYHVLDAMHAFHDASRNNRHVFLESTCEQPAPLPLGLLPGRLDP
ncbi:MAG TPA: Gfo/Idh/MocA family oxidoreductase [Limnochordia bacterium]|nr:Gfo/Idh/MocA family oxidoreductase [Limnochordia bacterium]